MKKSKVIVNSTPIIGLSILKKLQLLTQLFEKVYVPKAVYKEIVEDNSLRPYGKNELKNRVSDGTISLYSVENSNLVDKLYGKLHKGELEVIVAAKELNLHVVVIDELAARKLAKSYHLQPVGIVGLLILAKKKGLVGQIKPLLDTLQEHNFYISKKLYHQVLIETGEK